MNYLLYKSDEDQVLKIIYALWEESGYKLSSQDTRREEKI